MSLKALMSLMAGRRKLDHALVGHVDGVENTVILGWALDTATQTSPTVEVVIDGVPALSLVPQLYRVDIARVMSNSGRHAFEIDIPRRFIDGAEHDVEVAFQETGAPLVNGRFKFRWQPPEADRPALSSGVLLAALRSGLWHIDEIDVQEGTLHVIGWAIVPPGASSCVIYANDTELDASYSDHPSLRSTFSVPPSLTVKRFSGRYRLRPGDREVALRFGGPPAGYRPDHTLYYPLFERRMPEPARVIRVSNNARATNFDLIGYSIAKRVCGLSEFYCGKAFPELERVLEWGCGCGRVARFLAPLNPAYHGVDIDAVNVRWCQDNVPGRFIPVAAKAPLPFDDGHFEFAFGISVLTHLDREHEDFWLRELKRVLRPGGLAVLTVNGATSTLRLRNIDRLADMLSSGHFDLGPNHALDDIPGLEGYYRNVFHSHGYVRETWGAHFDVIEIVESGIANVQDAVILRR